MQELNSFLKQLIPRGMEFVLSVAIGLLVFFIGSKVIKKLLKMIRRSMEKREVEAGVISFCLSANKVVFYVILIVVVAQILGFATSSVVAILGSAGLAIGLALQGSLANFAGGVLILMMKPFCVDDYIIVGDVEGTVKKIDVVYTTLATIDNRAVILPNGKLADSNIINVTKEDKRRIDIKIGIGYDSSIAKVRDILQQIADRQTTRLPDMPVKVVVSELAESSVTMLLQMWVRPEDYWDTRWGMLEEIKTKMDENGIVIPYNQLDVHVSTIPEKERDNQ